MKTLIYILTVLAVIGAVATGAVAQTALWEESFTGQLGKGIQPGPVTNMAGMTRWSVSVHEGFPTNGYAVVSSNSVVKSEFFEAGRLSGLCIWQSENIDISAGAVDLSLQIHETGSMTGSDSIGIYYRLDGAEEVLFGENGYFGGDYGNAWITATQPYLNGTGVTVVVRMVTTAADKNHRIDNVRVTASTAIVNTPPVPVLNEGGTCRFAAAGDTIQFTVTATNHLLDAEDWITLWAENLPTGAEFSITNGVSPLSQTFTWTPGATGVHAVCFYAVDKDGTNRIEIATGTFAQPLCNLWINEFHYDNAGTDTNEGVEIAGPAGLDLSDCRLYFYNGVNGESYASQSLSGQIDNEGNGSGAVWFNVSSGIQNGAPDGLALVRETGGSTSLLEFLSYEGVFTAIDGPAAGWHSTDITVSEPDTTPADRTIQLTGSGKGVHDFTWIGPTAHSRGQLNAGQQIRRRGFMILVR